MQWDEKRQETNVLSEFLCFGNHSVDLLLTKTTLLVGDSNTLRLATTNININKEYSINRTK
jgi:hypothetical protein